MMVPWYWLVIVAMLAGSAGAILMAIVAVGARADRQDTYGVGPRERKPDGPRPKR